MKQPKCKWCGQKIPLERVYAAKTRGMPPLYCSTRCRNAANVAVYRAKHK